MQREGDALDANIKRTEKEVRALENTLQLMNTRNEAFRMTISGQDLDQKDMEDKRVLEQQFSIAMTQFKQKKQKLEALQEELRHLENALASLADDESSKLHHVQSLENQIKDLTKEIEEQQRKQDRAQKHCIK